MIFIGIIGIVTLVILIVLVIDLVLLHQNRVLKSEKEKIITESKFQDEIQNIRLEVSKETLNKIGQEIHDNWGQILSFTSMMLSQHKETAKENEILMNEARSNIGNVINSIRELSRSFENTKRIDENLFEQLQQLKLMNEKTGIVKNQLVLNGNPKIITEETSIIIVRMTQELMNNSVRHGNAEVCELSISISNSNMQYTYSDNGLGFDYINYNKTEGNGLSNIKSRLTLLNAEYSIKSSKDNGFILKATIPTVNSHSYEK